MHLSRALDVLAPNNLKGDGWQSLIRLAWKVHINYQERNCAYPDINWDCVVREDSECRQTCPKKRRFGG